MVKKSKIEIEVDLDENNVPQKMEWSASDYHQNMPGSNGSESCKALLMSVWDAKEQNTLKVDLWTKEMTVEEMQQFYHQTFVTMADTFERSTSEQEMANAMRDFAAFFGEKFGLIPKSGRFDPK